MVEHCEGEHLQPALALAPHLRLAAWHMFGHWREKPNLRLRCQRNFGCSTPWNHPDCNKDDLWSKQLPEALSVEHTGQFNLPKNKIIAQNIILLLESPIWCIMKEDTCALPQGKQFLQQPGKKSGWQKLGKCANSVLRNVMVFHRRKDPKLFCRKT